MSVLKITNPIICDFYHTHPEFDVEKVNLALIDFLKMVDKIQNQNNPESVNHMIMQNIQSVLCSDVVQNHQQELIEKHMNELKTMLKDMNDSDMPNSSRTDALKEYMNNFEMKSSMLLQNAQQPIYSFLSSSEDRLQQSISSIKKETSLDDESRTILKDISNMLSRLPEHICNEDALSKKLTKLYNTADIRNVLCDDEKQQVLMKRFRKPTTFFQLVSQDENVNNEQITDMLACVSEQNCNGILLSNHSGFSGKKDFHIDIHNNNIIVYIHNFAKNEDKLQMAIHIVDGFISRMNEISNVNTTGVHITQDLLEKINNEYQLFISQKTAVVDLLKENQKKVINQMDEIKFPCLDKYLSTKFSAPVATCGLNVTYVRIIAPTI